MSDKNKPPDDKNQFLIPIPRTFTELSIPEAEQSALSVVDHKKLELEALQDVKSKLVDKMPSLAIKLFEAWENAMQLGDSKVMRDVAEAIGVLQPKSGINIMNQVNNTNANLSTGGADAMSIEAIIRKMDAAKHQKNSDDIIDAEIIDDDGKG